MNLKELLARFEGEELEFRTKFSNDEDKERDIRVIASFYNGRGGVLIFGVTEDGISRKVVGTDLPPQVIDTGLSSKIRGKCDPEMRPKISVIEIEGEHVVAVECPRGKTPPYKASGKVYVRRNSTTVEATEDEIADLYKQRTPLFDRGPVERSDVDDLDAELLKTVFGRRGDDQILDGDLERLMLRNNLIVEDGGRLQPTLAGLLLFGKKPQDFLPHTKILFQIQSVSNPNEWEQIGSFEGNIFQQIDQIINFLTNNLQKSARIIGFERKEELEIPIQALREAVVNAVVHRDYVDIRSELQISVTPKIVRIVNPGGLVAPLTIREIERGIFNPTTRNPVIAEVLLTAGLMDKRGTGIPRINKLVKEVGLPDAQIRELTNGAAFEVVFTRRQKAGHEVESTKISLPSEIIKSLSDHEKRILLLVEKMGEVRPNAVESAVGLSRPKVNEILDALVDRRILQREAKSRTDPKVKYVLHKRFVLSTANVLDVDNNQKTLFDGLNK